MARYKNANWSLSEQADVYHASIAVLMDIRDELQVIKNYLGQIANSNERIYKKIPAKRRRKKAPKANQPTKEKAENETQHGM